MTTPDPGRPVRGSTTGRPIMAALDLLGRRWALRILWELRDGPVGARALRERCDGMSSSVLYERLRRARIGRAGRPGRRRAVPAHRAGPIARRRHRAARPVGQAVEPSGAGRRLVVEHVAGARTPFGHRVAGVEQPAVPHREAAATDALVEPVAQPLEHADLGVDARPPRRWTAAPSPARSACGCRGARRARCGSRRGRARPAARPARTTPGAASRGRSGAGRRRTGWRGSGPRPRRSGGQRGRRRCGRSPRRSTARAACERGYPLTSSELERIRCAPCPKHPCASPSSPGARGRAGSADPGPTGSPPGVDERPDMLVDPIDLAHAGLRPVHPRALDPDEQLYVERIGRADGFVVVTPEYNHAYPAGLKHAIDLPRDEWRQKPRRVRVLRRVGRRAAGGRAAPARVRRAARHHGPRHRQLPQLLRAASTTPASPSTAPAPRPRPPRCSTSSPGGPPPSAPPAPKPFWRSDLPHL